MPEAKVGGTGERECLPVGSVLLGTYRLDRILGIGAMGSVFAATHLRNANRVAVKVLHPELEGNSEIRTRFLREGYAANSVRHTGTVRALDDGIAENGAVFFVMELLDGETLEALWQRRGRRLHPGEVTRLMGQLLEILSAAHERGIVHRDIKPENLFVERDGTLRILDFGVARVLEGKFLETRAGSVIGTLPYMAPEQMLGKSHEVDARSDVWSVGATAFTLVSGCFVHAADTPEEMMVYTGSRQAPSLASVAPRVPSVFVEVVDRALRFDKSQRWPSARAMQSAFAEAYSSLRRPEQDASQPTAADRAVGSHGPASATLVSSRETARRPRQGVPLWAHTGLAALAVAGGIAALGGHGPRSRQAAPPSLVVPARASLLSFASQGARIAAAVADLIGAPAAAATPDAPTASAEAPRSDGPSARAAEEAPSVGRASFVRPPPPAQQLRAALGSNLRRRPSVDSSPSENACTPPFVIQASTGKKKWKRECL